MEVVQKCSRSPFEISESAYPIVFPSSSFFLPSSCSSPPFLHPPTRYNFPMPRFRSRSTTSSSAFTVEDDKKDLESAGKEVQLVPVEEGDEGEVVQDEVFGEQGGKDTVNFRGTGWKAMAAVMIKFVVFFPLLLFLPLQRLTLPLP